MTGWPLRTCRAWSAIVILPKRMSVAKYRALLSTMWIAALIVLLGLLTTLGILMREPTFEGKTTRAWLMDVAYGPNHASAVEVFKRTGSPMVPGLVRAFEGRGLRFAQRLQSHPWLFSHLPSGAQKRLTKRIETESNLRTGRLRCSPSSAPQPGVLTPEAAQANRASVSALQ